MMSWNREIIIRAKDKVKELFFACDLDGNGYIELFEFHTLVSCVDPFQFDFDKIYRWFNEYSDIYEIYEK